MFSGYVTFNSQTEVNHFIKPGTGLTDAPRVVQVNLTDIIKKSARCINAKLIPSCGSITIKHVVYASWQFTFMP